MPNCNRIPVCDVLGLVLRSLLLVVLEVVCCDWYTVENVREQQEEPKQEPAGQVVALGRSAALHFFYQEWGAALAFRMFRCLSEDVENRKYARLCELDL